MPDTPVEPAPRAPYDRSMEQWVSRLEEDMHEVKAAHGRLETMVSDVRLAVTRIEAALVATLPHLATKAEVTEILKTLPHLATKAELAEKLGKGYLVGMIGILLAAYAGGLVALAVLK
jgi:hypothetical protein